MAGTSNQMDKKIENEMETGMILGFWVEVSKSRNPTCYLQ